MMLAVTSEAFVEESWSTADITDAVLYPDFVLKRINRFNVIKLFHHFYININTNPSGMLNRFESLLNTAFLSLTSFIVTIISEIPICFPSVQDTFRVVDSFVLI